MIRVIPSLLAKDGQIVKGVQAKNDRVIGTVESSLRVQTARNVDEVLLVDVGNNSKGWKLRDYVHQGASYLRVPFTAGGGIESTQQVGELLHLGADKVMLGRKALVNSDVLGEASKSFGSQAVAVCIEIEKEESGIWIVTNSPGRDVTDLESYALSLQDRGAGEIVLFSRDLDGLRKGIALEPVETIARHLTVPLSYMGGIASPQDALSLAERGVNGIIAGSLYSFSRYTPNDVKVTLASHGFPVRI